MQPDKHPERHTCSWCGAPATTFRKVLNSVVKKKGDVTTVIEAAEYAPACWDCSLDLVETEDPIEVRKRNAARSREWKKRQETFDGT